MKHTSQVQSIIANDPVRWRILGLVRALQSPDCWVGAGFVRNTVWDHLHGRATSAVTDDVDVLWFDAERSEPSQDMNLEAALNAADPSINWSVKNQARMHSRNSDTPYASTTDAMRHWPESATAVAVRRNQQDVCEVVAPFGLEDLFALVLSPTPRFTRDKMKIYDARVRESLGGEVAAPGERDVSRRR